MYNDFFYYTKSQRRGILFLAILLFVVFSGWMISSIQREDISLEALTAADSARIDSFLASIRMKDKNNFPEKSETKMQESNKKKYQTLLLQPFDPNIADSDALAGLGLPSHVVRNILRYRERGGVFKTASSLSRIYGMDSLLFHRLEPYIQIVEAIDTNSASVDVKRMPETMISHSGNTKFPQGTVVDLNLADTSVLKKIPGIGSYMARKIVAYRNRLGGFVAVSQLQDIKQADTLLNKWFTVSGIPLRYLEINRSGLDVLRLHPYMNFYKAKAILEYRRKRGNIKSLSQLSMFEEFSEKDLNRLAPYLKFE